jgi:hypothetical protein
VSRTCAQRRPLSGPDAAFAEHDIEVGPCLGPFARAAFPFLHDPGWGNNLWPVSRFGAWRFNASTEGEERDDSLPLRRQIRLIARYWKALQPSTTGIRMTSTPWAFRSALDIELDFAALGRLVPLTRECPSSRRRQPRTPDKRPCCGPAPRHGSSDQVQASLDPDERRRKPVDTSSRAAVSAIQRPPHAPFRHRRDLQRKLALQNRA